MDFLIFNYFILHRDFWNKNILFVRNSYPNKFFLCPWDFDVSFGQSGKSKRPYDDYTEEYIRERSEIYNRLMNNAEFMENCKIRWVELRKDLWSEDSLLDIVSDLYEGIKGMAEQDMRKWRSDDNPNKFVKDLTDWIPKRLDICDDYFSQF